MISPQTSYRFDNRNYTGGAKESDEQEVALRRRKTTTKRSQRREHDQLPHPRVHLQDTFHFALILEAPDPTGDAATGRGLLAMASLVTVRFGPAPPSRDRVDDHSVRVGSWAVAIARPAISGIACNKS
jgi:hypothetical protein